MITAKQKFLAILATGRFANLPTVASNVIVAGSLASYGALGQTGVISQDYEFSPLHAAILIALSSMLYVGGCFLGDAFDAEYDAKNRPDRPIPSGVLSQKSVQRVGYILIFLFWAMICIAPLLYFIYTDTSLLSLPSRIFDCLICLFLFTGFPLLVVLTTVLAGSVLQYAKHHKTMGGSAAILMALCRGLLVLWIIMLTAGDLLNNDLNITTTLHLTFFTICIFLYTLCISLVARRESDPKAKAPRWIFNAFFILPPLIAIGILISEHLSYCAGYNYTHDLTTTRIPLISLVVLMYLAWMIYSISRAKRSIPNFVSTALAGFCLVDAVFATMIGPLTTFVCIALFILSLLLQRIAPAT